MRRWIARIFALIAASVAACAMATVPAVTTIDHAECVASDSMVPPPDSAPWRPISLPDDWNRSRPGFSGQVWYRLVFYPLSAKTTHATYVPRNSAAEIEFFVNGELESISRSYGDPRVSELQRPLINTVPTIMLRPGVNVIHIRVLGSAEHRHGLSRVTIGYGGIVRPKYYERRYDLQVVSIAMFGAVLLVAGLLALSVWWAERGEPVPFWFGVSSLAWAVSAYLLVWPPRVENPHVQQLLLFTMQHLHVIPLTVLCMRIGGARNRRLETLLWCAFAAACGAAALLSFARYPALAQATSVATLCLTISVLGWLVHVGVGERRWPLYSLGLALLMVIVLSGYDWARWMGFADFDNLLLAPFGMSFLILALGAAGLERHLSMMRSLEGAKRELERRVAEKVREVETNLPEDAGGAAPTGGAARTPTHHDRYARRSRLWSSRIA